MLKIYVGRNLMSNRLKEKDKHKWWLTNKIQSYCKGGFHHKQAPNGSQAFPPGSSVWLRHLLSLRTSGRCNARMSTPRAEVAFSSFLFWRFSLAVLRCSKVTGELQTWSRGNPYHWDEYTHWSEHILRGPSLSSALKTPELPWVWGCWVGLWGHSSTRGGEGARHHFHPPALPGESHQKNWPASIPPTRKSLPSHIPSLGLHPQAGGFRTKRRRSLSLCRLFAPWNFNSQPGMSGIKSPSFWSPGLSHNLPSIMMAFYIVHKVNKPHLHSSS